ncbi:MAG: tyrosine-protein phosphatase [Candidatus Nealsonbacteria bacterium]|nr:tyrosine-protein phosphatase [Candidatus Nealsonbacteria bacterium]
MANSRGIAPEQVDMTNVKAFYILQPSYIDASRNEAVKQYGSMEQYIRDGLHVTEDELRRLRESLLD